MIKAGDLVPGAEVAIKVKIINWHYPLRGGSTSSQ
jgi:hypothetical protein